MSPNLTDGPARGAAAYAAALHRACPASRNIPSGDRRGKVIHDSGQALPTLLWESGATPWRSQFAAACRLLVARLRSARFGLTQMPRPRKCCPGNRQLSTTLRSGPAGESRSEPARHCQGSSELGPRISLDKYFRRLFAISLDKKYLCVYHTFYKRICGQEPPAVQRGLRQLECELRTGVTRDLGLAVQLRCQEEEDE